MAIPTGDSLSLPSPEKEAEKKPEQHPGHNKKEAAMPDHQGRPMGTKGCVTIVSGLPRSGTSMMMQMLEAGGLPVLTDGNRQSDEDNPKGYFEFEPVKRLAKEKEWLDDAVGKSVKIVAQLLRYLPAGYDYRVILMDRDLDEVLLSQSKMLERQDREKTHRSVETLRRVFSQQLEHVNRMLSSRQIPTLRVNHRQAVEKPAETAQQLQDFLDVNLDEAAMAAIVDPKLYRQRK